VLDFYELLMHR